MAVPATKTAAVPTTKTATVPTAKTTSVQAGEAATMPTAEAAAVTASETAAAPAAKVAPVPGAETATVAATETPSVPCAGPVRAGCVPAPAESGPGMAEMSDRRTCSDAREGASHVTPMPPLGPDCREGQNRRTDKKHEGGRAENDEGRCYSDDDFGRR